MLSRMDWLWKSHYLLIALYLRKAGSAPIAPEGKGGVRNFRVAAPTTAIERRYALRAVKQRLHQASFREAVIAAYNGRCAVTGLPEPLLLDAAHIVADKNEQFGQPVSRTAFPSQKSTTRRSMPT
jgi:hypothetical protein